METMTLEKLVNMGMGEAIGWLLENKDSYSLITNPELEKLMLECDYWEGKATELADDIAVLLGVDIGEHTSENCPVENAINAVYLKQKKQNNSK